MRFAITPQSTDGSMRMATTPRYDRALALFPEDILPWVQETQPDTWDILINNRGPAARNTLRDR